MIRIVNLEFYYDLHFRLVIPELEVVQGQKVGIIGASGSGKTTLLNLISGIQLPRAGSIELLGRRIDQLSDADRRRTRRDHMGFVFQGFELVEYLTAQENILLPFVLHPHLRPANWRTRLNELCTRCGIQQRLQAFPSELSTGQRQRVALCRALITQPKLILADEPTASLDDATARFILALLWQEAVASHSTLIMVTHDQSHLTNFDQLIDITQYGSAQSVHVQDSPQASSSQATQAGGA